MSGIIEDSIDFEAFREEGRDYFLQRRQGIIQKLKQGSETLAYMETRNAIEDRYESGLVSTGEVSQGYQSAFTPKGLIKADLVEHQVHRMKVNDQFDPIPWFKEYISQFEPDELSSQMPFIQWKWELIEKQLIEDEELKQIAKGCFKEPVEGIAGAAVNGTDGFYTMIKRAIRKGYIKPIIVGSFNYRDAQDMIDFMDEYQEKIPRIYRRQPLYTLGYGELDKHYWKAYSRLYGEGKVDRVSDINNPIVLEWSNNQIVGLPSMDGLRTIIGYVRGALIKVMSRRMPIPDFQKDGHYWKMLTDYGWVSGFRSWEEVFVAGELIEEPKNLEFSDNKIKWEEVPEADSYYLTVSENSDFSSPLLDNKKITDRDKDALPEEVEIKKSNGRTVYKQIVYKVSANIPGLESGKKYYAKAVSELLNPFNTNFKSVDSKVLEFAA